MSQDKGGLGFFKQGTTTPVSLTKPLVFVKSSHDQDPKISETNASPDALTRQASEGNWIQVKKCY